MVNRCNQFNCNKKIGLIESFNCRYCKSVHCSKHRLPENHDCKGLLKGNIYRRYNKKKKLSSTKYINYKSYRGYNNNSITRRINNFESPINITEILSEGLFMILIIAIILILYFPNIFTSGSFIDVSRVYDSISYDTSPENAIDLVNNERIKYGKKPINFDQNLYELAYYKSKDMYVSGYFDHPDLYGKCADYYKKNFNIRRGSVADNLYYDGGGIILPSYQNAIDGWMTSRGHRYNLLFDGHVSGAIACYGEYCTFVGLNYDRFGSTCNTGDEGEKFWETVGLQPGEV